jgi:ACT domain-containing protein
LFFGRPHGTDRIGAFAYASAGSSTSVRTTGVFWRISEWHSYAVVRNGATVTFYRDGVPFETQNLATDTNVDWGEQRPVELMGKNFGASNATNGSIAMAAIWMRALSSAEISWLYAEPYVFLRPVVRRRWFVPSGVQTVPVGQALESDVAQAVASLKTRTVGQVLETDLAQPVDRIKALVLVRAVESDLAQPVARLKTQLVGQVVETDLARPVSRPGQSVAVGQALEIDLAQTLSSAKTRLVARVVELDASLGLFGSKSRQVTRGEEIDVALGVTSPSQAILHRLRTLWVGE